MNSDVGSFAVHFFHFTYENQCNYRWQKVDQWEKEKLETDSYNTNNFYSLLSDNWSFIRSIDLLGKGKTI